MAWDGLGFLSCRARLPASFSQISHTLPMNWEVPRTGPCHPLLHPLCYGPRKKKSQRLEKPWDKSARVLGLPSFGEVSLGTSWAQDSGWLHHLLPCSS